MIASIELKANVWPDALPFLCNIAGDANVNTKKAGLMMLSFVCETIKMEQFENNRDQVVGALLNNIDSDDQELTALALRSFNMACVLKDDHF